MRASPLFRLPHDLSVIDGKYGVDGTSVTFNSSKYLTGDFACKTMISTKLSGFPEELVIDTDDKLSSLLRQLDTYAY